MILCSIILVQTTSCQSSKFIKWLGVIYFTLKDVVKMMFAFLILGIIGILAVFLQKNEIYTTQKNWENDLLIGPLQQQSRALEKSLRYVVINLILLPLVYKTHVYVYTNAPKKR